VPPWWPLLLEDLQRNNFAELAGAHATAHVPLADRLVGAVVNASLPPDGAIRALELKAHSGNEFTVRVRLRKPALLPPLSLRFRIAHQPELPASPLLVLLLAPTGLGVLAGPALRMLDTLPPGIAVDGHRIVIDFSVLARRYGIAAFDAVTALEFSTDDGQFVVNVSAALPARPR
jgi:hypothetical protein